MVRNQYPLPLIAQLIANLSGAHIFSKVDVCQGYNNIRIKKGDEWKAAFKTKFRHWEPLVMFFGLTNLPSTFQEMMNVIYKEVIDRHARRGTIIRIYMDDIAIATTVLQSVDRSVRLGRLGVCPECLMAEVGKRLDYIEVRTTERWMNTQGESACQALKRKGRKGLCKVFRPKRMRCRDSTKYARERMYRGSCRGSTKYTTRTE
jgi:hypothetical protein